jgi:Uma2 family endonuclease
MNLPAVQFPKGIGYEDFLATVDEGTHAEWVDGEVVEMTPPTDEHARITLFLAMAFSGYAKRRGIGGKVRHSPYHMKLASSAREPDVLYVRPENAHRVGTKCLEGPADLVVEVVSPESRGRDRKEKFREYGMAGVREYWIIEPMLKRTEVFRLSEAGTYEPVPAGDPPRLRSEVLPGLWIDPEWLWVEEPDEWVAYREWGLI